jgi:hypothetical protein
MIQFGLRSKHIPSLFKNQLLNAMQGKNRWSENHKKYTNAICGHNVEFLER